MEELRKLDNAQGLRKAIDKDGNTIEYVDETVKRTLEITLIASVMKFNPYM